MCVGSITDSQCKCDALFCDDLLLYLIIGFFTSHAVILGCIGTDEGMYAWVVANYALGTLGGDPLDTTGIIELGGASAQVQFFVPDYFLFQNLIFLDPNYYIP